VTEQHPQSDEELLDRFQRAAFEYFLQEINVENGLVADRSRQGAPASIAVVGFALSCYPVAVERGWMDRTEAAARTLVTLRFFSNSHQSEAPDATGYKGFYYHFLDLKNGKRVWQSELSLVDTTFLLAGMLVASIYFDRPIQSETEIRELADALYHRMDWKWAQNGKSSVSQGWKPECGFLHYGWEGYDEAAILYVLGLASPKHPLSDDSFQTWTSTYQWENIYGFNFLYSGPLFTHEYSHAWIDFKGIQDRFMREKKCDYFENTRRAIFVQQEYARRNPHEFKGYCENFWGLTASDGPGNRMLRIDGRNRRFFGYSARGVPYGPDDGTISPSAAFASLPFAPAISLSAIHYLCERFPNVTNGYRIPGAFNPTMADGKSGGWISEGSFGLDQGMMVLMIENYRSQLIWKLMRKCPHIRKGLRKAGFKNGWL
jgi:hypothetical protein